MRKWVITKEGRAIDYCYGDYNLAVALARKHEEDDKRCELHTGSS